jgi:hypothetical protein
MVKKKEEAIRSPDLKCVCGMRVWFCYTDEKEKQKTTEKFLDIHKDCVVELKTKKTKKKKKDEPGLE